MTGIIPFVLRLSKGALPGSRSAPPACS